MLRSNNSEFTWERKKEIQGTMVLVRGHCWKNEERHIEWVAGCRREGYGPIREEIFVVTKWNQHVEEG